MRLGEIKRVTTQPAAFTPRDGTSAAEEPKAPSRALVTVAPIAEANEPLSIYRSAPFLAQLLAMRGQHPQTRERRRAEPDVAIAAYRNAAALAGKH